jgi:hypothetical protein
MQLLEDKSVKKIAAEKQRKNPRPKAFGASAGVASTFNRQELKNFFVNYSTFADENKL